MGLFGAIMLGLHGAIDRNEREGRKQAKLNQETWFQQNRQKTRAAAGRAARAKAKAEKPIRAVKKRKPRSTAK